MFITLLWLSQAVAPPAARPLGPQPTVTWHCALLGPAGETHNVSGTFFAPSAQTQRSYGSFVRVSVTVDSDTTGFLSGQHQAGGAYAVPKSFNFAVIRDDVITSFSMSYFGEGSGGVATVIQTDAAAQVPTFSKAIGVGYCQTAEQY